jgi:hypothetical protein
MIYPVSNRNKPLLLDVVGVIHLAVLSKYVLGRLHQ